MKPWWIWLGRYGLAQWPGLLVIGGLMIAHVGLGLLRPWPLKLILDNVVANQPFAPAVAWVTSLPGGDSPFSLLAWLTGATVAIFLAEWLAKTAQSYVQVNVSSRMVYALGADLFRHLQRLSLRFHHRKSTGDLVKRVTSDCDCVRELVLRVCLPLVTSVITLAGILVVMWRLDRTLALVALVTAPALAFIVWYFARPMSERTFAQYQAQGAAVACAEQALSAIPIVKAFGREDLHDRKFDEAWTNSDQAYLRVLSSQLHFKVATGWTTALGTAAVFAVGGWHVMDGRISVGSLTVFLTYIAALYAPLETLAYLSTGFASAAAGARRVLEVFGSTETVREKPSAELLPPRNPNSGHIRFENVTFGYERTRPVLHGVTVDVHPGEILALVGPTGAGKSSLMSLVPRLFDPWQGRVTFEGRDLRDLQIASLRAQVSIVLQEPFLLPLTVAENIAYGRPHASRAEIVAAAEQANAGEFIQQLPDGYDTVVGERGATLSGGQRQRIAIARALLKDAPVLLLDEPTSALDTESEAQVVDALRTLMRGRSTLLIAHRLSTIRDATRIAVLEEGRIVALGSHADLLRSSPVYHRLYTLQFGASPAHQANAPITRPAFPRGPRSDGLVL